MVRSALEINRPLTILGGVMLVVLLATLVGVSLDPRIITAAPAWVKPAKFAISISIYCFTFVWLLGFIANHPHLTGWIANVVVISFIVEMTAIFTQAATAGDDPRTILAWQPFANLARQIFPSEFALIDRARGATFPFSAEQIQSAHARWTADWLAWERAHDADYKLRAAAVEHEMGAGVASSYGRARLEAVEREKLERYQHRYEEYTRISKALKALFPTS